MQKQKGFIVPILIAIVTILVIGGGVYVYQNNKASGSPLVDDNSQIDLQDEKVADQNPSTSTTLAPTPAVSTTKITDKGNLYSVEIPKDWKIIRNEGAKGVQLSNISGESPDWKSRSDVDAEGPCVPHYYESGVFFQFHVENEEDTAGHYGEGGGPDTGVISKKNISVDGVNGVYHVFTEDCGTSEGQLVDAHFNYKGNSYLFRFSYNPAKYPQAETAFMNILNSIKFTK